MTIPRLHRVALICVAALLMAGGCQRRSEDRHAAGPGEAGKTARRTPLVELYDKCKDGVVNIRTIRKVETDEGPAYQSSWGSGWFLHPAGYIVTAEHVINAPGRRMVILPGGTRYDCRVIARYPPLDMALLRIDREEPFGVIKLGRSDDLMVGELAVTLGNPTGLWDTFSVGVISGLGRISGAAESYVYGMIQTDAGVNHGNSGGPLINALGEVIGVVDGMKGEAENIGFAVAIDQFRATFPDMISAEMRYGFVLGLEVDTMMPDARVTAVTEDSPAVAGGIAVGDVITRVGGMNIRHGLDFYLALIDRSAGEELPISLLRNGETIETSVTLGSTKVRPAVQTEELTSGLKYEAFVGQWNALPDFSELSAVKVGQVDSVVLPTLNETTSGLALCLTGYLKIPTDGLYTFLLLSDDGSRLYIGEDVLIDNDFLHMPQVKHGLIRLEAGMHPITVLYFDRSGGKALSLTIEGPGLDKQPVSPAMCFTELATGQAEIIDVPADVPVEPSQ